MADILRPIQPGDSWVTDEYGNVTGVSLGLTGTKTKLPRLTNNSTTPAASQQIALLSGVAITGTAISGSTGSFTTLAASSTTTLSGAVTMSPANLAITMSPTGTGTVIIAPATTGSMNNMSLGQTWPAAVKTSNLAATFTDSSATPGNVTNNSPRGRAAFAAGASTVVVTSSLVTAASSVFIQQENADSTLTAMTVIPAAGSFTVTGKAAATAVTAFSFLVVN